MKRMIAGMVANMVTGMNLNLAHAYLKSYVFNLRLVTGKV